MDRSVDSPVMVAKELDMPSIQDVMISFPMNVQQEAKLSLLKAWNLANITSKMSQSSNHAGHIFFVNSYLKSVNMTKLFT